MRSARAASVTSREVGWAREMGNLAVGKTAGSGTLHFATVCCAKTLAERGFRLSRTRRSLRPAQRIRPYYRGARLYSQRKDSERTMPKTMCPIRLSHCVIPMTSMF